MCNALESGGIVAQESQTSKRPLMLDQRILFIDAEAIVIDKPAGLPVDTPRRGGDSVVERLGELKLGFQRPPTPMHRLDQDTSGCLLLARNPKARSVLQKAFEARRVEKYYLAVVDGEVEPLDGVIEIALGKKSSAEAGWRMVADAKGDAAITHWRKIQAQDGRTLVEFRPATGRTHQLRVHAREAFGRGIAGDRVYGVPGGPMLLHASRLVVPRENKPAIDVIAPLPDYFGDWGDAS
jgi:tRNA pseudouridine32 synthase/23S rRNA pseudouridine746 synthase